MPANKINNRYGLNPAHSEVVQACKTVEPCQVLDMGCGSGRNALFLSQRGFDVTAVDNNPAAVQTLQQIVQQENITNIKAQVYDLNQAELSDDYGLIVCTVTLMFLNPDRVADVIADMQTHTQAGGYNLIVCAMDTPAHPCPMPFPFTFQEGELSGAYAGWELTKYNEDLGTMHNGARLQFATLLAHKT